MKLLVKSDIAKAKSVERQQEIQEGLKLAKRVDTLREVAAAEEASLAKWRTETVKLIQDEITSFAAKRDELQKQVSKLEADMVATMEPLDKRWIMYVQTEKAHIEKERIHNHDEAIRNERWATGLEEIGEELDARENALNRERIEVSNLRTLAVNERQEAGQVLFAARRAASDIEEDIGKRDQESLERKEVVTEFEKGVVARSNELDTREKDLEKRETDVLVKELLYYSPVKQNGLNNSTPNRRKRTNSRKHVP